MRSLQTGLHTGPGIIYVCCRTDALARQTVSSTPRLTSNLLDDKGTMITSHNSTKPFVIRFMETKPRILMEITNTTERLLESVEILTVFLKDEEGLGSPSSAHIRFDRINSVRPNEKAVVSHRTWINGKPASDADDQIGRLAVVAGTAKPYVLDISWEDEDGKLQFQRIPVGH
jgi:hypothetical protein